MGVASDAGFFDRYFVSPLYRLNAARPSQGSDLAQATSSPPTDPGVGEMVQNLLLGTNETESVLVIIATSFLFWLVIIGVCLWFVFKRLERQTSFMKSKQKLLYSIAQTSHQVKKEDTKAERWQTITAQVAEDDVTSWKMAIMDADILLDEILEEYGYAGEHLADKLHSARSEDKLQTLHYASQAHGVRNKIAHDSGFVLTHRDAKTTIASYERFFNELFSVR